MSLTSADQSRIIEMAWEDHTPFEAILNLYGLSEADVIRLMRQSLKPSSFRLWRERVTGRASKHRTLQQNRPQTDDESDDVVDQHEIHQPLKAYSLGQYKINHGRK